jgi:hypothetical protein
MRDEGMARTMIQALRQLAGNNLPDTADRRTDFLIRPMRSTTGGRTRKSVLRVDDLLRAALVSMDSMESQSDRTPPRREVEHGERG